MPSAELIHILKREKSSQLFKRLPTVSPPLRAFAGKRSMKSYRWPLISKNHSAALLPWNTVLVDNQSKAPPEEDWIYLSCVLNEIKNEVHCFAVESRDALSADFFWLDDYEKLKMCFRKGTFYVADFLCQASERRQSILLKTGLQNNSWHLIFELHSQFVRYWCCGI